MAKSDHPVLHFDVPFDERTAVETKHRGCWWLSHVELPDGTTHPVTFYDATRLAQDLEEESKQGRPFLAEPGMIVLEEVTRENMEAAIRRLAEEDFFG